MKVLIVTPWDLARGGVQSVADNLARHLTERGDGVLFFHPGGSVWPRASRTKAGFPGFHAELRLPVPGSLAKSTLSFLLFLPVTLLALLRLLVRERIDAVNIHYPLPCFAFFLICAKALRRPMVVSVHGADVLPGGRWARPSFGLRLLLEHCDWLTTPSAGFRAAVLEHMPELAQRSSAIHNGVDLAQLRPVTDEPSDAARPPTILCVAAHNPRKGVDLLLRAMAIVHRSAPDLHLELAGDGPVRAELESLAEQLGIAHAVSFLGFLDLPELRRHLQDCLFVVLPSRSESFGLAVVEAMAFGKAAVATRVGGIPEVVHDGDNGVLVEPENSGALAEAILRLVGDPELRRRLGAVGARMVGERFTIQHMGDSYEELFRSLRRKSKNGLSGVHAGDSGVAAGAAPPSPAGRAHGSRVG